jgi:hypothetical protein
MAHKYLYLTGYLGSEGCLRINFKGFDTHEEAIKYMKENDGRKDKWLQSYPGCEYISFAAISQLDKNKNYETIHISSDDLLKEINGKSNEESDEKSDEESGEKSDEELVEKSC